MSRLIITGGKRLHGSVRVSGSKNAALPILAATLLTDQQCEIRNVPDIGDVHTMLAILTAIGSTLSFQRGVVRIQTKRIFPERLPQDLCQHMRASILLLASILSRAGKIALPFPGGDVIGKRSVGTHVRVLREFGISEHEDRGLLCFRGYPKSASVVMPEFSVTATENALMAAASCPGISTIRLAALEPHIRDLCYMLESMGVRIHGIGTHTLMIHGRKNLRGAHHRVIGDYLEAGTFLLAGALTKSEIEVRDIESADLEAFLHILREMGVRLEIKKKSIRVLAYRDLHSYWRVQTNVFPGFPTDLQPPFCILLTQARGESHIHETLFEGRFRYFDELKKMGARIQIQNPHEAIVYGPLQLHGTQVKSCDIRAGAALILAALVARGKTVVSDIMYINRGYERFAEKLKKLGASIQEIPD